MSANQDVLVDETLRNIYLKMVDYLSRGSASERRLVRRIVRLRLKYPKTERYRFYTEENGWKAIMMLREEGLLNERQYAENVFASLKDKLDGWRAIRRKMLQPEINPSIVADIMKRVEHGEESQDFTKVIEQAKKRFTQLKQKHGHEFRSKQIIRQKLYMWLSLRGFDSDDIAKIVSFIDFDLLTER